MTKTYDVITNDATITAINLQKELHNVDECKLILYVAEYMLPGFTYSKKLKL
jgi:hypothetical protein